MRSFANAQDDHRSRKDLAVIILAAGKGTRMRLPGRQAGSDLPKALHPLCGQPMLWHLVEKTRRLSPKKLIVVAGHRIDLVRGFLNGSAEVVWQKRLLGSGHAVNQAAGKLARFEGSVLVLYCDTPLITVETMENLLAHRVFHAADCTLLSVRLEDPSGYGRIKRAPWRARGTPLESTGHSTAPADVPRARARGLPRPTCREPELAACGVVEKVIEHNDASPEEKVIKEINVGCYVFDSKKLFSALKLVRQNPKKKEYYLTDVIEVLAQRGKVESILTDDPEEVRGINTRMDLSILQETMQQTILKKWIDKGVRIRDPKTTTIDADVEIGVETVILPNTVIEEGARIGKNCRIGPFARIRGQSKIGDGVVIGNFVEVVRSEIGNKTYIKHLSYIGDANIGSGVNVGAGTITANYDGKKKHKTVIKDKAQIGSGTVLVAPVTVGRGAKTGAGAVVTKKTRIAAGMVFVGIPARELIKG